MKQDKFIKDAFNRSFEEVEKAKEITDAFEKCEERILQSWADKVGMIVANSIAEFSIKFDIVEEMDMLFIMMYTAGYADGEKHEREINQ